MENDNTNTLMAIVQAMDADIAEAALKESGFTVYQLPSVGGFLGQKNVTLVILCENNNSEEAICVLNKNCSQRIEYSAISLENQPTPIAVPTAVSVGGATIFGIESEQIIRL